MTSVFYSIHRFECKFLSLLLLVLTFTLSTGSIKAQTTLDFNELSNNNFLGKSFTYNGFQFTINIPEHDHGQIVTRLNGYNGTVALYDDNNVVGRITELKIEKINGAEFQFQSIYLHAPTNFSSSYGYIQGFKDGNAVGNKKPITFNSQTAGLKNFSSDPDFYNIDEIRITADDLNNYIDHFTYGPPIVGNAPSITSIMVDGAPGSFAQEVDFRVSFSENVTGVSTDDFTLTTTGSASGNISSVSGSGNSYLVRITNVSGEGTLKLDLKANTNIVNSSSTGNIPAYTSGQIFTASNCAFETFEGASFIHGANTFTSNGRNFLLTGLNVIRKFQFGSPSTGTEGFSDVYLTNELTPGTVAITSTELFSMSTMDIFVSDGSGDFPTDVGKLVIVGKRNGKTIYTITKTDGFPINLDSYGGFFRVNFATDGLGDLRSANIDRLEITISDGFREVLVDNFAFCKSVEDTTPPTGFTVAFNQDHLNPLNSNSVGFTISNGELGASYIFSINSNGGGDTVTGLGIIGEANHQHTNLDLSSFTDGQVTLYLALTDMNGNLSPSVSTQILKSSTQYFPPAEPVVNEDSGPVELSDDFRLTGPTDVQYTLSFTITGGILTIGETGITFGGNGNGTSTFTASGTLNLINSALLAATFTPTRDLFGTNAGGISFTVNNGTTTSDPIAIVFDINAVNDAPVITVPGDQIIDKNSNLVFNVANSNSISVADTDIGTGSMRITLATTNGLLTLSNTSGLSFETGDGTGDTQMIFTGTITNVNAALNGLNFTPSADFSGTASLQIISNDQGNTGSGGAMENSKTINIQVQPSNPIITSVDSYKIDGTYGIGEVIMLSVTFDQPVVVNTTGGVPLLAMETGTTDEMAVYTSIDNQKVLNFIYTVQQGNTTPALDYNSTTSLSLEGATIKNADGKDAIWTLPAPGTAGSLSYNKTLKIDGVRPEGTLSLYKSTLVAGDTTLVTIQFTEPITGLDLNDFEPANGTLSHLTQIVNGLTYTAVFTPSANVEDASNVIGLDLSSITDQANNPGSGSVYSSNYVIDNAPPVVRVQNITVQLDATGIASITAAEINNGSSDGSGIQSMSLSQENFDCSQVGSNIVTLTVTDVYGNSANATAFVTVEDKTAPVVITRNITIQLDATGNASITAADIDNGSADACGIASMSLDQSSFDCSDIGLNVVTLTVTDVNGNTSTATAVVTVEDTTPPIVITRNISVELGANGIATIEPQDIDNGSTDACGIVSVTLDKTSFNYSNIGPNTVTLTLTDVSGNTASATAIVTITDTTPPTVITKNITIYLDAAGVASITPTDVDNGSTDNSGIANMSLDKTNFNSSNIGLNVVVLTVTDLQGLFSVGTAVVTVEDNLPPVVVTQNITIQLDSTGHANITPEQIDNGSTDNVGIASMALSKDSFDCSNIGLNVVTLTVTDVNGLSASATAVLTVEDKIAPVVRTQNIEVQLDDTGNAIITAGDIDHGSTDNCGIATYTLNKTIFNRSDVGEVTITLTITDVNGNSSSANAVITVLSPTPKVKSVTLPGDGYYLLDQDIVVNVHFTEDVIINTTAGAPYIPLIVGYHEVWAEYIGSLDSKTMQFSYTVQQNDYDMDGIEVLDTLILNNATIRSVSNRDVILTFPAIGSTENVFVNTKQPEVVLSTKAVSPVTSSFQLLVTFSEQVSGFDLSDVQVVNGKLSDLRTADDKQFTFQVEPLTGGRVEISIPEGVAMSLPGNSNKGSNSIQLQHHIAITGVNLSNASFVYDGTAKSLSITGTLPTGTTVSYLNNGRNSVGAQEVTATISGTNYITLVLKANLTITPAARSITFPVIPQKTFGDSAFSAGATASNGETVQYTSSNTQVATVVDGVIRIVGAGTTQITATVPENSNYSNRPQETQELVVKKAAQSIQFTLPASVNRNAGSLTLNATSSSGLPVTYEVNDAFIASVNGNTLQIHRLGTVRVVAKQVGNANYEAAAAVERVLVVNQDNQTPGGGGSQGSDEPNIRVHQAVSPNGDGINDFLIVEGITDYPENKVTILNVNGVVVWESRGYNNGSISFKGLDRSGRKLSHGTYFLLVEVRENGVWKVKKSFFVIR